MRLFITVLLFGITSAAVRRHFKHDSEYDDDWKAFKEKFGKVYQSAYEDSKKRETWESNLKLIQHHNIRFSLGESSYTMAMNNYGDLSFPEFKVLMKSSAGIKRRSNSEFEINGDVPPSIDWRTKGCVSAVVNQGQCGSSVAFSATGALEGQNCRKTGSLIVLSVQNLLDCVYKQGCNGGGSADDAFAWVQKNGIESAEDYPTGGDGSCKYDPSKKAVGDNGFVDVESGNETALTAAIGTLGPVSVAVDASQQSFQFYSGGVYDEPNCSSTQLDHELLAVGYSTDSAGGDYYIAKNTWGVNWGMNGYILMSRNKMNQCGIATYASFPII